MKKYYMILKALLIVSTICMGGKLKSQEIQVFKGSFEECKQEAKTKGKLIFVDLYFEGCIPCKEMDVKVFPDPQVVSAMNKNYVMYKTDVFKELDGKKLARKYAVYGFPTYLVLSSDGKLLSAEIGFKPVDELLTFMQQAEERQKGKKYYAFDTNLDHPYPIGYSARYMKDGQKQTADEFLKEMEGIQDKNQEYVAITMLGSNFDLYNTFVFNNLHEFIEKYGEIIVVRKADQLTQARVKQFGMAGQVDSLLSLLDYVKPAYTSKLWSTYLPLYFNLYYKGKKDVEGTLRALNLYEADVDWNSMRNLYADLLDNHKLDGKAMESLIKFLEKNKGNTQFSLADNYNLALCYAYQNKFDQAERVVNAIKQSADSSGSIKTEELDNLLNQIAQKQIQNLRAKKR